MSQRSRAISGVTGPVGIPALTVIEYDFMSGLGWSPSETPMCRGRAGWLSGERGSKIGPALRPSHASLWLRPSVDERKRTENR